MDKKICLKGKTINCELKKSKRAKHARIVVLNDSAISITIPYWGRLLNIEKVLLDKQDWILEALQKFKKISMVRGDNVDFKKNKKIALKIMREKVEFFNQIYNFSINKIMVRNQGTRWGSCSSQKNLNFNYRLIYLPAPLLDYVVVHELCHLREMNHSKRFWSLVSRALPDYKKRRKELKIRFRIG